MAVAARRRERELARSRAHEERLRSLTELSADWFWETDAAHRITWLSGGGPVATLFRDTPTYGRHFWEIPGVEVDARALQAHLERLQRQLPFFDLEIARTDERGARQVHIISGQSYHGPDGAFRGYRGVGRDVTEQRRADVGRGGRYRCGQARRGGSQRRRSALPRCRRGVERIRLGSRCPMALHLSFRAGGSAARLFAARAPRAPRLGFRAARRRARHR